MKSEDFSRKKCASTIRKVFRNSSFKLEDYSEVLLLTLKSKALLFSMFHNLDTFRKTFEDFA